MLTFAASKIYFKFQVAILVDFNFFFFFLYQLNFNQIFEFELWINATNSLIASLSIANNNEFDISTILRVIEYLRNSRYAVWLPFGQLIGIFKIAYTPLLSCFSYGLWVNDFACWLALKYFLIHHFININNNFWKIMNRKSSSSDLYC